MNRLSLVVLVMVFCAGALLGEILAPLNSGLPIAPGDVENPLLFRAASGELFFAGVSDGALLLKQGDNQGQSFRELYIDYQGVALSGFSDLKFINSYRHGWLLFFTALLDGAEGIFAVKKGDASGARLLAPGSLTADALKGPVESYRVFMAAPADFLVAYLAGGQLGFSLFDGDMASGKKLLAGSGIASFDMRLNFTNVAPAFCGLLTKTDGSVDYYTYNLDTLSIEPLAGGKRNLSDFRLYFSASGKTFFLYVEGNRLFGEQRKAGGWEKMIADVPLSVVEGVTGYQCFGFDDNSYIIYYTGSPGNYTAYGFVVRNNDSLLYLKNGNLLFSGLDSFLSLAPHVDGNLLLLSPSGGKVQISEYDRLSNSLFAYPGYKPADFNAFGGSFVFSPGMQWVAHTDVIASGQFRQRVYAFRPDQNGYPLVGDLLLSEGITPAPCTDTGIGLLVYDTAGGKLLVNPFSGEKESLGSGGEVFSDPLRFPILFVLYRQGGGAVAAFVEAGGQE